MKQAYEYSKKAAGDHGYDEADESEPPPSYTSSVDASHPAANIAYDTKHRFDRMPEPDLGSNAGSYGHDHSDSAKHVPFTSHPTAAGQAGLGQDSLYSAQGTTVTVEPYTLTQATSSSISQVSPHAYAAPSHTPSSLTRAASQNGYAPPSHLSSENQQFSTSQPFPKPPTKSPGLMKKFAPGESVAELLTPPPPSFLRQPPEDLSCPPFPPLSLVGRGAGLDAGFMEVLPPVPGGAGAAHPFATHDVQEEDWVRFVGDVKKAAGLSFGERMVSNVLPAMGGMGFIAGKAVSMAMDKKKEKGKSLPTGELIDHWNRHFFNSRGILITLAKGSVSYTGQIDEPPPDHYTRDDDHIYTDHTAQDRREGKREAKYERKQQKREAKQSKDERWRLVVSSVAPGYMSAVF